MRKYHTLYLTIFYFLAMFVALSCTHEKNELVHDHEHEHEHGHEHSGHEGHNHGAGQEITLEPEQAASMGVKTAVVEAGPFAGTIRATGKITESTQGSGMITAPTSGIFRFKGNIVAGTRVGAGTTVGTVSSTNVSGGDANAAALAELNSARQELERLKPLYEKKLVTAEKFNAAQAAYDVAKARYSPSAATGAVTSPCAGTIKEIMVENGQYVEAGTPIALVSNNSSLTLTVDVPERYSGRLGEVTDARIITPGDRSAVDVSALGGKKIPSTGITVTPGYIPVIFSLDSNDGRLRAGSVAEVYLLCERRDNVISVPLTAVTEQQGNHFVFVKVDDEGYIKSPVRLGERDGKSVEVLSGLHAGDEVVTEGVTALRLAETSGNVPEGHTHSH